MSEQTPPFRLIELQRGFAAHIRDPKTHSAPHNVEDRRMKIYRDLFYNNVEGFISGGFPVLRSITSDEKWHRLARDFFSGYRCQTPYFMEISGEFLQYLQSVRKPEADDFPFMLELAHYEWVEMVADTSSSTIPENGFNPKGNLLSGQPLLSPLAYVLHYEYPVHRIASDYIPSEKPQQPTFLIVYRNDRDEVKFMEINGVTARLLTIIEAWPEYTGLEAIALLAEEMKHPNPDVMRQGGIQILNQLQQVGIVLGTTLISIP